MEEKLEILKYVVYIYINFTLYIKMFTAGNHIYIYVPKIHLIKSERTTITF